MTLRQKHNANFGKLNTFVDSLPEEMQLQIVCVQYAERNYPEVFLHHSPNEWGITKSQRLTGKLMGVQAGFPDVQLIDKDGNIYFIEFKSEKGELSGAQKELNAGLSKLGYEVIVIRRFGEWQLFLYKNFKKQEEEKEIEKYYKIH